MARAVSVRRSEQGSAGRMTFLKRPLAHTCVYVYVCVRMSLFGFSLCLFLEWKRLHYKDTGHGPEPRSGVTCTFAFHEVARTEKEIVHTCMKDKERERVRKKEKEQRGQRRADDAGARIRDT